MARRRDERKASQPVEPEELASYDVDRYQPDFRRLMAAYRAEHQVGAGSAPSNRTVAGLTRWLQDRAAVRDRGMAVPPMRGLDHLYLRVHTDGLPRHLLEAEGIVTRRADRG